MRQEENISGKDQLTSVTILPWARIHQFFAPLVSFVEDSFVVVVVDMECRAVVVEGKSKEDNLA